MSSLKIYDKTGSEVGDYDFPDELMELERGTQAVHDVVVAYQAAQRQGTASTLSKGEVAGSNHKPWRQKGTGRARAGYRQSPIWRGGAVAFGPKPRDFSKHVNRKVARLAFRRALSERISNGDIRVVEALSVEEPKTKAFAAVLKALDIAKPALVIVDELDTNLMLAARNVPDVEVALADSVNVYQLLRYPQVVVSRTGLEQLKDRMKNGAAA